MGRFQLHRQLICWTGLCLLVLLVLCAGRSGSLRVVHAQGSRALVSPAPPASVAEADGACARCHAEITRRYLGTPHALASGSALAKLIPGAFTQAASGITYSVGEEKGEAWLGYTDPLHPGFQGRRLLEDYLGSGHLGVTYLFSTDGYLFESPVAYYTRLARYDMKPGLADTREGAPAIPIDSSCLRCHMSGVAEVDRGTLNHYSGAPFQYGGITCESCHGDSSAHVRSGGKSPVVNPLKLTAERRDSVCISCHLEGDVSVEKSPGSALDYRPGDSIARYVSFFVYNHAGANARGVSEVEQFAASRCKRASGESMSCTNCHDPHSVPLEAERVAYYRAKCLNCHGAGQQSEGQQSAGQQSAGQQSAGQQSAGQQSAGQQSAGQQSAGQQSAAMDGPGSKRQSAVFAATHHPENPDCTSCHMPRSTAENIPHVAWTDHRILRILARPDVRSNAAPEAATNDDQLVPIFSPMASSRDLALALYAAVMDGHAEDGAQAYALLTQADQKDREDVEVLNALGTLANMKGDSLEAGHLFASVLALDPKNRIAATDLAVLQARNHNLAQARALLQPVFDRNQDLPAVAQNLAAIDCLQGDAAAARTTLETALRFSPGSHELQQRLAQIDACRGDGQARALPHE